MARVISLLLVIALLGDCFANENETASGFGYELLLAKMDYLEYKFLELQVGVKEQSESLQQSQDQSKSDLLEKLRLILEQQKMFSDHQKMMDSIFELRPRKDPSDNSKLIAFITGQISANQPISSCQNEPTKKSGRYRLKLSNGTIIEVYCEQSLYGGGWLVFQSRFNGSVEFYRNWSEYQNGFGSLDGEFWLGLDKIHMLTSSKNYELMIHLEDFNGLAKYAHYKTFKLGGSSEKYSLKELGAYNGTANDSLTYNNGKMFSTHDVDNDSNSGSCTSDRHGAWWHGSCTYSNLNGIYKNAVDAKSMSWYYLTNEYKGLKISKMMIRDI